MTEINNTEADDVRHIRYDVERLRTQMEEDRKANNAMREDDRKVYNAQRKEEHEAWTSVVKELSSISGSLKVLLDDRMEFKSLVARVFSRLDHCDARDSLLSERLGILEAKVNTVDKNADNSGARTWDIVKYVLIAVIGAILAVVLKK